MGRRVAVAVGVAVVVGVAVAVVVGVAVAVAVGVAVVVAVAVAVAVTTEGVPMEKQCPFQTGSSYLIRTVTMAWVGVVKQIVGDFLVLGDASWVADLGRYHLATCTENLAEIEPVAEGEVFVNLASIVDAREWHGALPREAK